MQGGEQDSEFNSVVGGENFFLDLQMGQGAVLSAGFLFTNLM